MTNERSLDRATAFLMQGRFHDSINQFDRALDFNPRQKIAWSGKGLCLLYLRRYKEALYSYDRAMKIDPSFAPAWKGKGLTLEKMGLYEDAVRCYSTALKYQPDNEYIAAIRDSCFNKIQKK